MAEISETAASLRVLGDELDTSIVTAQLGVPPHRGRRKGETFYGPNGQELIARTGSWSREVARRRSGNLDAQIAELLSPLTNDLAIWRDLTARFHAEIFCGVFLEEGNEGIGLRSETLLMLGARGLSLDLNIYGPRYDLASPTPAIR